MSWVARRWANTARPILVKAEPPKGFLFNRRHLKTGEKRVDPKADFAMSTLVWCSAPIVFYIFCKLYYPRYKNWRYHRMIAYEEILKEDELWAEKRKHYGLDQFPRHIWHDSLTHFSVLLPTYTFDEPWPGTQTEPVVELSYWEKFARTYKQRNV